MKPKHTPGPWRSLGPTQVNGPIGVVKDTSIGKIECTYDVATVHRASKSTEYGGLEQAEANARLIAAAPEMYELLHAIWAKTDPSKDPKTCRAIANLLDRIDQTTKARGES